MSTSVRDSLPSSRRTVETSPVRLVREDIPAAVPASPVDMVDRARTMNPGSACRGQSSAAISNRMASLTPSCPLRFSVDEPLTELCRIKSGLAPVPLIGSGESAK